MDVANAPRMHFEFRRNGGQESRNEFSGWSRAGGVRVTRDKFGPGPEYSGLDSLMWVVANLGPSYLPIHPPLLLLLFFGKARSFKAARRLLPPNDQRLRRGFQRRRRASLFGFNSREESNKRWSWTALKRRWVRLLLDKLLHGSGSARGPAALHSKVPTGCELLFLILLNVGNGGQRCSLCLPQSRAASIGRQVLSGSCSMRLFTSAAAPAFDSLVARYNSNGSATTSRGRIVPQHSKVVHVFVGRWRFKLLLPGNNNKTPRAAL